MMNHSKHPPMVIPDQKRPRLVTSNHGFLSSDDSVSLMSDTNRRVGNGPDVFADNHHEHNSADTTFHGRTGHRSTTSTAVHSINHQNDSSAHVPITSRSSPSRGGYGSNGMNRYPSWYTGNRNNTSTGKFGRRRQSLPGRDGPQNNTTANSAMSHDQGPDTSGSRGRFSTTTGSGRRTATRRGGNATPAAAAAVAGPYIVCAINENNAKQTSVVSFDLDAPIDVQITKLSNGQSYAETLGYMRVLQPALVLYNEQNNSSHLTRQLLEHFHPDYYNPDGTVNPKEAVAALSMSDPSYMLNAFHPQNAPPADICKVKFIHRRFFRQTEASLFMERLARPDTYNATLKDEYIITSAFHALIKYSQQNLNLDHEFVDHSISLNVNSGEDGKRMDIDKSTLTALEILTNARTGKSKGDSCLISTIDCTKTSVGSRLLRSQLMAPPCRPPTIEARLELVDEFVANEVLFDEVEVCLKTLPPLDKLLAGIALKPKNRRSVSMGPTSTSEGTENVPDYLKVMNKDGAFVSLRQADKEISALVAIKHTLGKLPALARALEKSVKEYQTRSNLLDRRGDHIVDEKDGELDIAAALRVGLGMASGYDETRNSDDESQSQAVDASKQLLRAIHGSLTQPELDEILTAIEEAFLPSTAHRRNSLDQKFQVCFAVKSDGDSFLDVHRHQLMANLDDIYKIANSLSEKYQASVTVKHTAARGWHLRLSKDMKDDLPDEFIYPSAIGNYICCTTEEVYSLSNRATSNIDAILYLTLDRVQDVLDVARMHYPVLARVTDAVALLDLCHCFADKITLATEDEPWTRPVFTEPSDDGSEIVIKNGRFGIDIDGSIFSQCGPGKMIPNDTNSPSSKPLTIITGINGSGKTMYIKQIAIIVLLAHCGCYVPAESARITITHQLFARMGMSDDQESNLSSFMVEMKETAHILANAKKNSLVLFDELGRATSNEEGVSIAWSVAEELLGKGCKTFFVTHYPELTELEKMYSGAQNQHLQSIVKEDKNGVDIRFSHKVGNGPCRAQSSYGVDMAGFCGFPEDILKEAKSIEQSLRGSFDNGGPFCVVDPAEITYGRHIALKSTCEQVLNDIRNASNLESLCNALQVRKAVAGCFVA